MSSRTVRRLARLIRKIADGLDGHGSLDGTWIDVGAHRGESTLHIALANPRLKIYALEPNLVAAATLMGRAPNYIPIPIAVAEEDGVADFYLNSYEGASSLLPFNENARRAWIGGDSLKIERVIKVPTMRLDTVMSLLGIARVDFLKIDTQGMDLSVLKSTGSRLSNVMKVFLEVDITAERLYSGSPSKREVVDFLEKAGFTQTAAEKETHGQEENLTFVRNSGR